MMQHYILLTGVLALAACGGGGGGASYDSLLATTVAQNTKIDGLDATPVLPSNTVNYSGTILVADNLDAPGDGVIGSANLTANFVNETITGSAGNFYSTAIGGGGAVSGPAESVPGSLSFNGENIGIAFDMDVTGTVTLDGGSQTIDGTVTGGFLGDNADMLVVGSDDVPISSGSLLNADVAITAD